MTNVFVYTSRFLSWLSMVFHEPMILRKISKGVRKASPPQSEGFF